MKHLRRILPLFLLLLVACAGAAAREEVQLPSMQQAWAGVRAQIVDQLLQEPSDSTNATLAAADAALSTGGVSVAAVDWPALDAAAEACIARREASGDIGPDVAGSLRERLLQFRNARKTYTRTR